MGYSTGFAGSFRTNRVVDEETYRLLHGLATTRRMKRKLPKTFGVDGEFYIQDDERGIVDKNRPPRSQPSLWCGWLIQPDRRTIQWDGHEKFQEYIPWLIYLIRLLRRRGYTLSGNVAWQGKCGRPPPDADPTPHHEHRRGLQIPHTDPISHKLIHYKSHHGV